MSETVSVTLDTEGLNRELGELRDELGTLVEQDINPLTEEVGRSFAALRRSITQELDEAAKAGRFSVQSLVDGVLKDFARITSDALIRDPLENAIGGLLGGLLGGARAGGGTVLPSSAYLVGERGPEVFVPATAGQIRPSQDRRAVSVTVNVAAGGGDALGRSKAQIAAATAAAVSRSMRNA